MPGPTGRPGSLCQHAWVQFLHLSGKHEVPVREAWADPCCDIKSAKPECSPPLPHSSFLRAGAICCVAAGAATGGTMRFGHVGKGSEGVPSQAPAGL